MSDDYLEAAETHAKISIDIPPMDIESLDKAGDKHALDEPHARSLRAIVA